MKYHFVLLFLLLLGSDLFSQASDSLRQLYIEEYPDKFSVWPVVKQRALSFRVGDRRGREDRVEFKPNTSVTLGMGFYLFEVIFEFGVAIPVNEKSNYLFGESQARDWQANIIAKKFTADLFYQKYNGFYVDDPRVTVPEGTPFPQRPDAVTRNLGFSGVYIFNNRKFSLRSAYNYAERQRSSRGSLIAFGTLNSFRVGADTAMLTAAAQSDFGIGSDFKQVRHTSFSIGPGYSHTVTWHNFFINGTLGVAPAHHWVRIVNEQGIDYDDISINSVVLFRMGIGYNGDRFFGGLAYSSQTRNVFIEEIAFSNVTSTMRFVVGMRFQESGILKKRAWDIVPVNL